MNKKKLTFFLLSFYLYPVNTKRKHPKWDLGKKKRFFLQSLFYRHFKSKLERLLRRLLNDQNDWYNVLGSGEPYQFEPPVLEEESYASNNSFDGLKRERMIHFLYKWLLWKRRYIIEMNTFRNSFRKSLPHAVSLFGFCCVRAHVELSLWMRKQMQIMVLLYLHSCTARCDVMWCDVIMSCITQRS